jgi:hypothetical protein
MPESICSIKGCGEPVKARGWCSCHYRRWYKHGDPLWTRPTRLCAVEGCGRPHAARAWCEMHYLRWCTHGDPLKKGRLGPAPRDPADRFWSYVNKNGPVPEHRPDLGPCWEWTGGRTRSGYGAASKEKKRRIGAHAFAVELLVGAIPAGMEPDHLCRNRACVKAVADEHGPAHLEVVTKRENVRRGTSPAAINARKTHCKRGHPFDDANTMIERSGSRQCRICKREALRRWRANQSAV